MLNTERLKKNKKLFNTVQKTEFFTRPEEAPKTLTIK